MNKRFFITIAAILFCSISANAQFYEKMEQLEPAFYKSLMTCSEGIFQSKNVYGWRIYGMQNGKCSVEQTSISYTMKCFMPESIAKKYGQEGLKMYQQKGFVSGSQYINNINNNKNYCTIKFKHKK